MSAPVQNCIILFGDSITQGGWTPGLNGFGEQLTRKAYDRLSVNHV